MSTSKRAASELHFASFPSLFSSLVVVAAAAAGRRRRLCAGRRHCHRDASIRFTELRERHPLAVWLRRLLTPINV